MDNSEIEDKTSYEELCKHVTILAKPLASKKLNKRLLKVTKKAYKQKTLKIGIKAVQKAIRKGETGIIILAGDTTPIDIISHMPALCEEKNIPYIFTPSKNELGAAFGSQRCTCTVLIHSSSQYEDLYGTIKQDIESLPIAY